MEVSLTRQEKKSDLSAVLKQLFTSMSEIELKFSFLLQQIHPSQRASAINLLHYLYMRSKDLEPLQKNLHLQGFSTFNNAEGYIQSQLLAVLQHFGFNSDGHVPCDYFTAQKMAGERVTKLFGKVDKGHIPSIMVTFKTSFADDYLAVKKTFEGRDECSPHQLCA